MFRTGCVTVSDLIQGAYIRYADGRAQPSGSQLKSQPLQGGPAWIDSDRYTVDAKPEAAQTWLMMGGPMLQVLLENRLKLKVHRESKQVPVYALVVAEGGPKLQATKEGGCTPSDPTRSGPPPLVPGQPPPCGFIDGNGKDGIDAVGVPIATLCQMLSGQLGRAVVDKTGLTGPFNYHLDFNAPPPGARPALDDPMAPDPVANLMATLRRFGLKLEPSKATAEFLVIDHIERPTEN
jgi:uncharacterized protein (TIGR03435 family)